MSMFFRVALISLSVVVIVSLYMISLSCHKKSGTVILLNGTSSSGKSAILEEFCKLRSDYTPFKMDDYWPAEFTKKAVALGWQKKSGIDPWLFLLDYATKVAGKPQLDIQVRALLFADQIPDYYHAIKEKITQGNNVIIDAVVESEKEFATFSTFFKNYKVHKILVYCPLDVLLQRVEERNKSGVAHEMRHAFAALEQFPQIYKVQEHTHEQVVGVLEARVIKEVLNKAIQELIDKNIPDAYVPVLEEFKYNFIRQFKLDEQEEISIVSKNEYNAIVNTGRQYPIECAKIIINQLSCGVR